MENIQLIKDKKIYYLNINKKIILKFIFLFSLILLIKKYLFYNKLFKKKNIINKTKTIKICICTTGKKENRYIREFLTFYEKYGIDKIFLYDNNDINGEFFEDIIKDFIDKGFVKIFNWRGKKRTGYTIRNDCYLRNKKKYDWLIFYDIDEYIHLKNYTNIKTFLNEQKFKKCLKINLNWVMHTDNNLIYYDNRSLHERFPVLEKDVKNNKKDNEDKYRYKYILRGRGSDSELKMNFYNLISKKEKGCNGNGKKSKLISEIYMKNPDFEFYYIDHYYFKSVQEFIEKINKGDNYYGQNMGLKMVRINRFFKYNKITIEKVKYIEKYSGINLTKFKYKLSKKI